MCQLPFWSRTPLPGAVCTAAFCLWKLLGLSAAEARMIWLAISLLVGSYMQRTSDVMHLCRARSCRWLEVHGGQVPGSHCDTRKLRPFDHRCAEETFYPFRNAWNAPLLRLSRNTYFLYNEECLTHLVQSIPSSYSRHKRLLARLLC